jgi:hypothetical protein
VNRNIAVGVHAFLTRHTQVLQSGGAVITVMAAVLALIVVPWQIGAADRTQQAQSARDIYRDFLNLTVQKPEVATTDLCSWNASDLEQFSDPVTGLLKATLKSSASVKACP